jgi:hypothetical protein
MCQQQQFEVQVMQQLKEMEYGQNISSTRKSTERLCTSFKVKHQPTFQITLCGLSSLRRSSHRRA